MHGSDHLLNRWMRGVGPPDAMRTLADMVTKVWGPRIAVFAVDGQRNVVMWSSGAEELLGFSAEEMVGQHCLKANRCETCIRTCGLSDYGHINDVSIVLHRNDGTAIRVRKTARAIQASDGTFAGGVEILVPEEELRDPVFASESTPPRGIVAANADDTGLLQFHGLWSRDPGMHQAFRIIRNVGETEANVLIRGESGTGKELAARAVHNESMRRDGPFLAVNCAALSPTLLESELFGHVRGAFTGAVKDRLGLFRQADGGTLFLDEVAELPLDLQAKLLRVLQERIFVPVGGTDPIQVDIRIVAATHKALRQRVREGEFREDLMYRLRVVPIYLPPLRARRGDVELLLWHYIARFAERGPRAIQSVAPEAMRALLDHEWPGNVRELINVIQYASAVGRGPTLLLDELPPEFREDVHATPAPVTPRRSAVDEAEQIREALVRTGGHIGDAAKLLGISRPTFWRRRKKYGV